MYYTVPFSVNLWFGKILFTMTNVFLGGSKTISISFRPWIWSIRCYNYFSRTTVSFISDWLFFVNSISPHKIAQPNGIKMIHSIKMNIKISVCWVANARSAVDGIYHTMPDTFSNWPVFVYYCISNFLSLFKCVLCNCTVCVVQNQVSLTFTHSLSMLYIKY